MLGRVVGGLSSPWRYDLASATSWATLPQGVKRWNGFAEGYGLAPNQNELQSVRVFCGQAATNSRPKNEACCLNP